MVIFPYNLYIFVWIQHGFLANMVFALVCNNSFVEVIHYKFQFIKPMQKFFAEKM